MELKNECHERLARRHLTSRISLILHGLRHELVNLGKILVELTFKTAWYLSREKLAAVQQQQKSEYTTGRAYSYLGHDVERHFAQISIV